MAQYGKRQRVKRDTLCQKDMNRDITKPMQSILIYIIYIMKNDKRGFDAEK